jgi:hypothetical protein
MKLWRLVVGALLAILVVVAGYIYLPYVGWNNSRPEARARAEAYLAAVVGGSEDRGWSLLEASGRNEFGSEEAYRRLMDAADWSQFTWELRYNGVCDDGVCSFVLHLPNGRASAPEAAWSHGSGDPGVLVATDRASDLGEAYFGVLQRGWFGGIGVGVSGVSSDR